MILLSASRFSASPTVSISPGMSQAKIPTESDFWRYDPITDKWIQLADVRNIRRWGCVSFSIDNEFYLGLGQIFESSLLYDNKIYRYIPNE